MSQRYVVGKFAFLLRKWLVVGTQRRWRGINTITKDPKFRTEDDVSFNNILEQNMEGYYSTTARFLWQMKKDIATLQFGIVKGNWNELTDVERANVRKTIIDISTMILFYLAGTLLAGLAKGVDDDDDKEMYYTMAYMFRRHYSEIAFFSDPTEAYRIMQTPSASLSMLQKSGNVLTQLFKPTEHYQRGIHKDKNKLLIKMSKTLPILATTDRNMQDAYEWLSKGHN